MGEYARSLAIARAARARWDIAVHFAISRDAPYAADAPFEQTLLPASPTFHSAELIALMEKFRPDVVIFDNAGRTAQLRAAARLGARVVFISARARQRRKAFRWRWMPLIDEHWIAYPQFIAGALRPVERFKLRLIGRPVVRYLDVLIEAADPGLRRAVLARIGCEAGGYALLVPGGGTGHPGVLNAPGEFRAAARSLAAGGLPCIVVGPPAAAAEPGSNLHLPGLLPHAELTELMRGARLVVANGGSTLIQGIACGAACVAVGIAKDQALRVRRCVDAGVAVAAALRAADIAQAARALLAEEPERAALARRAAALGLRDGIQVALEALAGLLGPGAVRA
jgi:hypothetical protein